MAIFAMGADHLINKKKVSYQEINDYLEDNEKVKKILFAGDRIHIKSKNGTFTVAEMSYRHIRLETNGGRNFWVRYNDFNKKFVGNLSFNYEPCKCLSIYNNNLCKNTEIFLKNNGRNTIFCHS